MAASLGPLVVMLVAAGLLIWLDRVNTLREAHSAVLRLSRVLAEQTERTVQAIDLILTRLAEDVSAAQDLPEHDPAFQSRMRQLLQPAPFIRALFVVGPDGYIIHDTDHPATPRASLADREYFTEHVERDDLGLHIGLPLRSRSVGTWFLSASRRIPSADGSFAGVAVAAIEPRYFERFYGDLALGEAGSIALLRRDGILIVRHPNLESAIGLSYASYEPFRSQLGTTPTGTLESEGAIGGANRVLAYRAVEETPLVVTVGIEKQSLLAEWRQRALVTAGGALGIALLGAASLLLLIQRLRQRAAIQQQLAQAEKLDAVGAMAAGIVHDFRNLLGTMASGTRLIRRRAGDAALAPILDEMDAAADRGTSLATKLLTLSQQQQLALEEVDVNQLLLALQPLLRTAAGSNVRLKLKLAPEVWPCWLDRAQFDRAILNLVVNARDAMPDGGEVRVATANEPGRGGGGVRPIGEAIRVTVADHGQGMSPEIAQRALEPFYTTKGPTGTGLGLSQVVSFVRQVGGDLRIHSQPGVGTKVELLFPRLTTNQRRDSDQPRGRAARLDSCAQDQRQPRAEGRETRRQVSAPYA